jgi:hypothetical protein
MPYRHLQLAVFALCVLALAHIPARNANAEEPVLPAGRQGYFLGLGLVQDAVFARDHGRDLRTVFAQGAALRLGQMVTQRFGLGLHINGASGANDDWRFTLGGLQLDAQVLLWRALALHVGVGAGGIRATDQRQSNAENTGTGGGFYSAAVAYDFFPWHTPGESGGLALVPVAEASWLPGNFSAWSINLGLQVVWWTGLSKSRLLLSDEAAYGAGE